MSQPRQPSTCLRYLYMALSCCVFTLVLSLLCFFYVWPLPLPLLLPDAAIIKTRGLAAPVNKDFEALVVKLRQEDEQSMTAYMASLAFMQLRIDGTIPLWGAIVLVCSLIGTAIGAVVALVRRMDLFASELKRHNEVDEIRFAAITDRIEVQHKEIREDLSEINSGANNSRR